MIESFKNLRMNSRSEVCLRGCRVYAYCVQSLPFAKRSNVTLGPNDLRIPVVLHGNKVTEDSLKLALIQRGTSG